MPDRPLVLGHEIAAVIVDGAEPGVRVVLEPAIPCGRCATCQSGHLELCPTTRFAGFADTDGGLRTWMTWPKPLVHPIPPTIDDDDAGLLEALGVAVHAVHLAGVDARTRVAVIGCGPIGLLVIKVLRAHGVEAIAALDPLGHRATAAEAAGAVIDRRAALTDAGWVDVVIECAGPDPAVAKAVDLVRPGGRIVLVGIPSSEQTAVPASIARRKGVTLQWCRRMRPADFRQAIDLAAAGRVELGSLITHRFGLDDVDDAFRVLSDRSGLKVIVRPSMPW
jgi:L-iditol 2-dehydrogenase